MKFLLLLFPINVLAQTSISEVLTTHIYNGTAASRPSMCTSGDIYFATDATAGANIYEGISPSNIFGTCTWTQEGTGSSVVTAAAITSAQKCVNITASDAMACGTASSSFTGQSSFAILFSTTQILSAGSITLNVDSQGAASVLGSTGLAATSGDIIQNRTYLFIYDGTHWLMSTPPALISAALLNGTSLAGLATGLLFNTTGSGAASIKVIGTDVAPATSGAALLSGNSSGGFTNLTTNNNQICTGTSTNTIQCPSGGSSMVASGGSAGRIGATAIQGTGAPSITTNGCSASLGTGSTNLAGFYTSGTTGTCTLTLTLNGTMAYTHLPSCIAIDQTTPADTQHQVNGSSSTTTFAFSGTTISGDVINYVCIGY